MYRFGNGIKHLGGGRGGRKKPHREHYNKKFHTTMEGNIQALGNLVELRGKILVLITSVPTHPKQILHVFCNLDVRSVLLKPSLLL